jgi:hypothetical protein
MIIVYLPADPKFRAFVERTLEFLQHVYKDEVLADLRFVAYSTHDPRDLEEARKRGITERFSHYKPAVRLAVVAEYHRAEAIKVFRATVEEVTHHALWDPFNFVRVVEAMIKDVPRLKTITRRITFKNEADLRVYVTDLYTKYVVYNYFIKLNDEPAVMPWDSETLVDHLEAYYEVVRVREILRGGRKREDPITTIYRVTYEEIMQMRNPLSKFREAVHKIFTEVIKRFPAEVYNSNPSRYEVLYKKQSVRELPL